MAPGPVGMLSNMRSRLFAVAVLSLCLCGSGCSSGVTWTVNEYRGATTRSLDADFTNPQVEFALLCRQLVASNYTVASYSGELMIAVIRYDFSGSETWSGAKAVVSRFAEPLANGVLINPYGKNAWAEIRLSVQPGSEGIYALQYNVVIKTWGEPDGIGGAGPFPLNSRGVLEDQFSNELIRHLSAITRSTPRETQPAQKPVF